jgi:hypothetical protein
MSIRPIMIALALLTAAPSAALAQKSHNTPEAAANALVQAIRKHDEAALRTLLGDDFRKAIPRGSVTPEDRARFLAAWNEHHRIVHEGKRRAIVAVGRDGWTLPLPLVRVKDGWRFDVDEGAEEMRRRRIGRNELATIQAMLAYHDAQKEYASTDRDGDGVLEYARRIASSKGRHDGLYWRTQPGRAPSPLGPLLAKQRAGEPYFGYRFKILEAQGARAPGGAFGYVADGQMTRGFALVAWPAEYGDTGIMTFLISHDGKVYQRDLGPDGAAEAKRMKRFDPGRGWKHADTKHLP